MRLAHRQQRRKAVERDLARLADGTLETSRRQVVERLDASSPELQARLREQRHAATAARHTAQRERAPLALRIRRRTLADSRRRPAIVGLALGGFAGALVWPSPWSAAPVPG
jgi:anti-sigma factor RsiW